MSLDRHLQQRGARKIWQLRVAVPRALHKQWGKRERIKSMGTSDRDLAVQRALPVLAQWRQEERVALGRLDAVERRRHVPSDHELEEAAVILGYDLVLEDADKTRLDSRGQFLWEINANWSKQLAEQQACHTATRDHDLVRSLADEAVNALDFHLPPDSEGYARLCDLLNSARLSALRVNEKRAAGDVEAVTDNALVQRVRKREAATAKPSEKIADLFEGYARAQVAAKKKRPAGVDQDRMVIDVFADFIGKDRAISSIGYDDAKDFVDALAKLPSGYRKKKAFKNLTVRQAIAKGEKDGMPPITIITQARYISTVSPFFDWLKSDKGGRHVTSNPFADLHIDTSKLKKANARPPFTAAQITTIINSPLFTGFLTEGKEHIAGNLRADDWRYWIPLICLFTGARIGEVAQLHVDDIAKIEGIWCVEFRHDEAAGQRTKNDKTRLVALHSTLLRIGLLEFLERQKERAEGDGNRQLFPDLEAGPRGQFGDKPSKWWRRYLDKIEVKAGVGKDGFGSHSFRHTMADQLRAAGALDAVFGPLILGHATSSVTGGYGEASQGTPGLSASLIESVKFLPIKRGWIVEGGKPVDFSHLYASRTANRACL